MPPLAWNIASPEAADCAAVMLKYGPSAGVVASVSRGPPDSVHRAPTGTIALQGL
jgi:hypothetical protein